jgi:hypothetical protein
VAIVRFASQDVAGNVALVKPLHDHHDRGALLVEAVERSTACVNSTFRPTGRSRLHSRHGEEHDLAQRRNAIKIGGEAGCEDGAAGWIETPGEIEPRLRLTTKPPPWSMEMMKTRSLHTPAAG